MRPGRLTLSLIAAALLAAAPARAQQAAELTLKVTPSEAGLIGAGLGELPYKTVKPLMDKLQGQINDQATQPKPADPPKPEEPRP